MTTVPYIPPGVNVQELVAPSIQTILAAPTVVCIVGQVQGYIQRTDSVVMSGTTAIPLPNLPTGGTLTSVVSVLDANGKQVYPSNNNPTAYVVTTDYTVQASAGTITRVSNGLITDPTPVNITYQYIPADYWNAVVLDSFAAIQSRFGPSSDANGNVLNPLVYGSQIAFENGIDKIVCQPLFVRATPGDPTTPQSEPTTVQAALSTTWADTLYVLRDTTAINVIVPIVGQSMANVNDATQLQIVQTIQDHCYFQLTQNNNYIMGFIGEDSSGSSTFAQKGIIQNHASTLQSRYGQLMSQHIMFVSPAKFARISNVGSTIFLGGQYMAAAIAGMLSSRGVQQTITRQEVSGFTAVVDARSRSDKNVDAGTGLTVVEMNGLAVQIRHCITLDNSSTARRELSVVRQKFWMIESMRLTLENDIIGQVIADQQGLMVVAATVQAVLEALKRARAVIDYSGIDVRTLTLDPTTVEVRFSYKPAFPINYIDVYFSLDLTGGQVTASSNSTSPF